MLQYAIYFIIAALVFGVLGFTKLAGGFASIAKFLFTVFIILFVISLIF